MADTPVNSADLPVFPASVASTIGMCFGGVVRMGSLLRILRWRDAKGSADSNVCVSVLDAPDGVESE
jgi:hypothetical protein